MKGYFYLHYNLPVISTESKPEEPHCHICGGVMEHTSDCGATIFIEINSSKQYETALKEWESQLIDVKNKTHRQHDDVTGEPTGWGLMDFPDFGIFTGITPGTRVEHNNGVIHKIL